MNGDVLLIDDEAVFREDLAALLRIEGFRCRTAGSGEEGLRLVEEDEPDVVLSDLVMSGMDGIEVVNRIVALHPQTCVIMMTAHGTMETAVQAFRTGVVDYVLKPVLPEDLYQKIRRCVERKETERELRYLRRELSEIATGTTIVGASDAIEAVRRLIARVGPSSSSILITGESGTGKELVARLLHETRCSDRRPFIAVNCAALPRDLVESELFGHVRGAFTGAHRDKAGYFSLANGGTLFLDEIGELPTELQPKLLRAIELHEIYPVGSSRPIRTTTRIVTATNRDLRAAVAEKRFREDLFFRIGVVEIAIPPLRDRREDIPLLIEHLLRRINAKLKRRMVAVDTAALRILMSAPWKGNVRELENVLERAVLLADGSFIGINDLPPDLTGELHCPEISDDLRQAVRAYEREHIRQVLAAVRGNREDAARRLGVDASTLYRRLKDLDIQS